MIPRRWAAWGGIAEMLSNSPGELACLEKLHAGGEWQPLVDGMLGVASASLATALARLASYAAHEPNERALREALFRALPDIVRKIDRVSIRPVLWQLSRMPGFLSTQEKDDLYSHAVRLIDGDLLEQMDGRGLFPSEAAQERIVVGARIRDDVFRPERQVLVATHARRWDAMRAREALRRCRTSRLTSQRTVKAGI
jgi:hypothetical protein